MLMRGLIWFIGCCLALPGLAFAQPQVEVVLGPKLAALESRIDTVERFAERNLRSGYDPREGSIQGPTSVAARQKWLLAGALAEPDMAKYGLKSLLAGLARESLVQAGLGTANVRLTLNELSVPNHGVSTLRGVNARASGLIEVLGASGAVERSLPVSAQIDTRWSLGARDFSAGFQFLESDERTRVGPTIASFTVKALKSAYPDAAFPTVSLARAPGVKQVN
jgi:hypothetical protein